MNVLYIGEIGDAVNTLFALSKVASKVVIINTDLTHFYDEMPDMKASIGNKCRVWDFYKSRDPLEKKIPAKFRKLWRYTTCHLGIPILKFINRQSKEYNAVKSIIAEENIQIAFAGWGTSVIPDILFLRTVCPDLPIVHYLPSFPTSYDSWLREKIEIALLRKVVHHVNGFIAASRRMKDFLMNTYGLEERSILICPIFYTSEYFAKEKLSFLSESDGEPHLVFTGTTNFSYTCNNVRDQLTEITHSKIHVHCNRFENKNVYNPYLHFFERYETPDMVNGSLATFLTQFDGCLVLYNAPPQLLRYQLSIPQRFLFCFTAGIPIFIPRGIFKVCEEIVKENQNGILYDSIEELNTVLRNPESMKTLKKKAGLLSHQFSFEAQAGRLSSFLSTYLLE